MIQIRMKARASTRDRWDMRVGVAGRFSPGLDATPPGISVAVCGTVER